MAWLYTQLPCNVDNNLAAAIEIIDQIEQSILTLRDFGYHYQPCLEAKIKLQVSFRSAIGNEHLWQNHFA